MKLEAGLGYYEIGGFEHDKEALRETTFRWKLINMALMNVKRN